MSAFSWQREQRLRADSERKWRHEQRVQFFLVDAKTVIPDLEFETPLCTVCGLSTNYDNECFACEECGITWPRSGYGSQALVDRDVHPHLYVNAAYFGGPNREGEPNA